MEKARLDKIIAGEGTYSRREVRLWSARAGCWWTVCLPGLRRTRWCRKQWRLWWTDRAALPPLHLDHAS
ncbi:MAG: hypothetical protein ACLTYN_05475 [Dysosmobacter welbionis]